ncbi:LOW QUALITY PROTEIN: hypothetical protein V1478_013739 [Vespula squamosa]|uniref:Uncharacterized protein n=1 Tax=Vespula squamosa TaxID=30214 RepID=A0ABD2A615_VESSQ
MSQESSTFDIMLSSIYYKIRIICSINVIYKSFLLYFNFVYISLTCRNSTSKIRNYENINILFLYVNLSVFCVILVSLHKLALTFSVDVDDTSYRFLRTYDLPVVDPWHERKGVSGVCEQQSKLTYSANVSFFFPCVIVNS